MKGRLSYYSTQHDHAQPTSQPANQPTSQPANQPTSQPANQPTSQPANQPTSQPANQPTSQPTRLTHSLNTTVPQVRLKGLSAATNYSLADYCCNLAEHYHVNAVRFDRALIN